MQSTKGLTWPFLVLALLTTLVFMAGLAAMQRSACNDGFPGITAGNSFTPNTGNVAAFGLSDGWGNCHKVLRFYWFTFAFVMATLLGILVTAITPAGLHYSRPFWTGMLSICIVLMMIACETFTGLHDTYKHGGYTAPGNWMSGVRVVMAGAIMSVPCLVLVLMLSVGTDWEPYGYTSRRSCRDDKATGVHTNAAVA